MKNISDFEDKYGMGQTFIWPDGTSISMETRELPDPTLGSDDRPAVDQNNRPITLRVAYCDKVLFLEKPKHFKNDKWPSKYVIHADWKKKSDTSWWRFEIGAKTMAALFKIFGTVEAFEAPEHRAEVLQALSRLPVIYVRRGSQVSSGQYKVLPSEWDVKGVTPASSSNGNPSITEPGKGGNNTIAKPEEQQVDDQDREDKPQKPGRSKKKIWKAGEKPGMS
jgi:hypothetical protein